MLIDFSPRFFTLLPERLADVHHNDHVDREDGSNGPADAAVCRVHKELLLQHLLGEKQHEDRRGEEEERVENEAEDRRAARLLVRRGLEELL